MPTRINYIGSANARVITRANLTGAGLPDPGVDLVWNKANSYELDVDNLTALFLIAQGDFLTDDALNFGEAASVLGGSGVILDSKRITTQFTMSAAGTAEDIPTALLAPVFDGRPLMFKTTPLCTSEDTASAGKLITLTLRRQSDSAIQQYAYREQETALANQIQPHKLEAGPFTAWPSDGTPFVVGEVIGAKLNLTSAAGTKASTNGATQAFTFYAETC